MSGLKPTEMTIRDLLQEELRRRGVTVVPEFSVSTPVGRMMPDMLLKNGAQYVVETKLGAEAKLLDAMMKLYEYSKFVAEAKGAFAVLFPEELRRPWSHDVIVSIATSPKTEYRFCFPALDLLDNENDLRSVSLRREVKNG